MAKTVVGLMDSWGEAQEVVRDLTNAGVERDHISVMASEKHARTGSDSGGQSAGEQGKEAGKGALAGAGTGAAIGGVAGLVLSFAPLAIPGIGPILAAGPIAAALTGAGIGAVAGGLIGGLTKVGVPEEHAHYYAEGVRRGGTLVTVHAEDDAIADQSADILRRHGAVDVEERGESWKREGWSGRFDEAASVEERAIPVVQEELAVGKRQVTTGGVRVYSRVVEQPVSETVNLEREQVDVQRRAVNRPAEAAAFQERSFEVKETAEEPVVEKQARVVEEVTVGKQKTQQQQTVQDTVKKTDVEVERTAGSTAGSTTGSTAGQGRTSRYSGPDRRSSARAGWAGMERRAATR